MLNSHCSQVRKVNYNQIEWKKWEKSQNVFTMEKVFGVQRSPINPKREKQYEYDKKKKRLDFQFTKENRFHKRHVQRRFRAKWRMEQVKKKWHIPVAHEYHTYGYETW